MEKGLRDAKNREPGNLVPGHFLSKIRTFFRNQSFKDVKLKNILEIDKIGFNLIPVSLYLYMNHQNIYSYSVKYD